MNIYFLFFLFLIFIKSEIETNLKPEVKMIVNLIRHGARTPSKMRPEFGKYFTTAEPGKLTLNGFRQMVMLGRVLRDRYINNKSGKFANFIDIEKIREQFLLISSPNPRAIESGIAYSLGLFPEYVYKIYDVNNLNQEDDPIPPIIEHNSEEIEKLTEKHFNFIIENRDRDVMFHSRRCKFPEDVYQESSSTNYEANYGVISEDERKLIYNYYKEHFNITLYGLDHNGLTDKLAHSLYTGLRCINFNIRNKISIPNKIHLILKKIFAYYLFMKRTDNDEITKITSSPFLDHLLEFFDHKVLNIEENLDFYHLGKFGYRDLRFVSYSGHDYNFVGLIKNLIRLDTISHYINNIHLYHKHLIIPFASNFDFHLIKWPNGEYYVKMFLNGEEIFEKIRSHTFDGEIIYDKEKGIPYKIFKKILKGRIFEKYNECLSTKKMKKTNSC
jgi:hypothetical protein